MKSLPLLHYKIKLYSIKYMSSKHLYVLLPLGISLIAAIIYLSTAPSAMQWVDSLNLLDASVTLGVNAPPAPLYVLLGHLFSLLPIGSYIFRLQFLSATLAAASLFFLFRITVWIAQKSKSAEEKIERQIALAGVFSMLTLGFSYEFWTQAQNTEIFTLECFLLLLILYLLLVMIEHTKKIFTLLITGSVLLGLSLGTDPVVLCFFPSVLFIFFSKRHHLNPQKVSLLVLCGILAVILVYSYLPLASMHNPFLNWGRPTSLSAIWTLATGHGQNGTENGFTGSGNVFVSSFERYFIMLFLDFTPLILPFILLGLWFTWEKQRYAFWVLSLIVLCNFILSVLYLSGNQESWYLLSDVCFAIVAGMGFFYLSQKIHKNWALIILFIFSLSPLVYWWSGANRHGWNITNDYIANLYNPIKAPAIVFGGSDGFLNYSYYVHDVNHDKPGVIPVLARLFYTYTPYQEDLAVSTTMKIPDPTKYYSSSGNPVSADNYSAFVNDFFATNITKYAIYIDDPAIATVYPDLQRADGSPSFHLDTTRFKLVPQGLVYQVVPLTSTIQPNLKNYNYQFSHGYPQQLPTILERENANELQNMTKQYAISYLAIGDYVAHFNELNQAAEYYKDAYTFDPTNSAILSKLGLLYAQHGQPVAAQLFFKQGMALFPGDPTWAFYVAQTDQETGDTHDAITLLQQVITNTPNTVPMHQEATTILNRIQ